MSDLVAGITSTAYSRTRRQIVFSRCTQTSSELSSDYLFLVSCPLSHQILATPLPVMRLSNRQCHGKPEGQLPPKFVLSGCVRAYKMIFADYETNA